MIRDQHVALDELAERWSGLSVVEAKQGSSFSRLVRFYSVAPQQKLILTFAFLTALRIETRSLAVALGVAFALVFLIRLCAIRKVRRLLPDGPFFSVQLDEDDLERIFDRVAFRPLEVLVVPATPRRVALGSLGTVRVAELDLGNWELELAVDRRDRVHQLAMKSEDFSIVRPTYGRLRGVSRLLREDAMTG